jgi:hypothetical protein
VRIVIKTDVGVRGITPILSFRKFIGKAEKRRVGMPLQDFHPEVRRPGYARNQRVVISEMIWNQQVELAVNLILHFMQSFEDRVLSQSVGLDK